MLLSCNNEGCFKQSNALLNTETLEVICQECGKPISNISESMKRVLKSSGQIIRQSKQAFMLACHSCKANREVVLNEDNETVCGICHNPIKVHDSFRLAMEEAGGMRKITTKKAKKKTKRKSSRKKT